MRKRSLIGRASKRANPCRRPRRRTWSIESLEPRLNMAPIAGGDDPGGGGPPEPPATTLSTQGTSRRRSCPP